MQAPKNTQDLEAERAKKYKYYTETRGEQEIAFTNKQARTLSELNMSALESKPVRTSTSKALRKQDFLYVLLPGAPPFPNQFSFLQLPGETLLFLFGCFEKGLTEKELRELRSQFDEQAKILHERINQISKTKPLVFACHSYGCYVFAVYCQMFNTDRIVGIIDVGGAPIRFYPAVKSHVCGLEGLTLESVLQNLDAIYQNMTEISKKNGIAGFQNKLIMLGMSRSVVSGVGFKDMFEYNRKLPKVLKCFIFGRKDVTFPESLMNEKAIFYSHQNKLNPEYHHKLQKTYERYFGVKCDNVQQKFIYSIEGGFHAIHMQRKYKELVAQIVHRYLDFLEEVYTESPSL